MFDTNVFRYLSDNAICLECIRKLGCYFHTNVQKSELLDNPDVSESQEHLKIMEDINSNILTAKNDIWMDSLRWNDKEIWCEDPNTVARRMANDKFTRKKYHYALIGACTKQEGLVLVTNDGPFTKKMAGEGVPTTTPEELFKICKHEHRV